jgi:hypothetical protein
MRQAPIVTIIDELIVLGPEGVLRIIKLLMDARIPPAVKVQGWQYLLTFEDSKRARAH